MFPKTIDYKILNYILFFTVWYLENIKSKSTPVELLGKWLFYKMDLAVFGSIMTDLVCKTELISWENNDL